MYNLLPLANDKWRRLSVMLDDEHFSVFGCSPFRKPHADGDAVDAVDEAPLRIAIVKADVGVFLHVARLVIVSV